MRNKKLTMNIGIISFMVVFIILCLVTFAILSLSSAYSNLNTTNKSIEHMNQYYELSSQGEMFLKDIDDSLYQLYQKTSTKNEYFHQLETLKKENNEINISNHVIQYDITHENMTLHIELEVLYPGEKLYHIITWKTETNNEWNPDQGLDIL